MSEQPEMTATRARTLASLREANGLSQREVAEAMGVRRSWVSKIEAEYPNVRFPALQAYLKALGAHVVFTEWDLGDVWAVNVIPDPERQAAVQRRKNERLRYLNSLASAKEPPLQSNQADTGGDDTGREVDQPDPQGDQSDSAQGQEP